MIRMLSFAALGTLLVPMLAACDSRGPGPTNAVTLQVTEQGFVPAEVTVDKGKPVTLTITRKTNRTCANEIVIKDYGINQPLPLDQPVTVTFTPKEAGPIRYACGMNMISGTINAR
jgi:plastocyanin domain-containing protein